MLDFGSFDHYRILPGWHPTSVIEWFVYNENLILKQFILSGFSTITRSAVTERFAQRCIRLLGSFTVADSRWHGYIFTIILNQNGLPSSGCECGLSDSFPVKSRPSRLCGTHHYAGCTSPIYIEKLTGNVHLLRGRQCDIIKNNKKPVPRLILFMNTLMHQSLNFS